MVRTYLPSLCKRTKQSSHVFDDYKSINTGVTSFSVADFTFCLKLPFEELILLIRLSKSSGLLE